MMPPTATSAEITQQIHERIGDNTRISSNVTVFEMSVTKLQKRRKNGSSLKRKHFMLKHLGNLRIFALNTWQGRLVREDAIEFLFYKHL
jgi:hypothetical protein